MLDTFNKLLNINFDNDIVLTASDFGFVHFGNTLASVDLSGSKYVDTNMVVSSFQRIKRTIAIDIRANASLTKTVERMISQGQRIHVDIEAGAYTFASEVEDVTGRFPVEYTCMPVKLVLIE